MPTMPLVRLVLCSPLLVLLIAGCPPRPGSQTPEATELQRFESQAAFEQFFKDQAIKSITPASRGGLFGGFPLVPAAADDGATNDAAEAGSGEQDADYSTTNIQEIGVDESDVIKSDGMYFYMARGETVRIVKADPVEELEEVAQITVGTQVDSMYLYNDTLIIVGQLYEAAGAEPGAPGMEIFIWPPYQVSSSVVVSQFDIREPSQPVKMKDVELDGALVTSRLTGGQLIVVLTYLPELPAGATRAAIESMTIDEIVPQIQGASTTTLVSWDSYYRPSPGDGYASTVVATLDADDVANVFGSTAVLAQAGTIYASTEALYTTNTDYDANDDYRETTIIHKFAFQEQAAAKYVGSGKIPGRLLNQFSLGEQDGYLRVATHVDNFEFFGFGGVGFDDVAVSVASSPVAQERDAGPYNALYVLEEDNDALEVVGSIEGIAPGEDLYSARFVGDHAFLVTFRRIDPLFVVDLSEPNDPTMRGELKIPGYSDYLHPVGDDLLIGVGRAVDEQTNWTGGVQLSLFDVSDWDNPTAIEQIEIGGGWSWTEVASTHKAFTFVPSTGLLAIPVQITPEVYYWEGPTPDIFDGVICYRVSANGFDELGRLECVNSGEPEYVDWGGWWGGYRRAALIGETVYALSEDGVRAAPVDDFEPETSLELE